MMVVGIPKENLTTNAMEIILGKYRIKAANSGIPQRMREAIEFSHKHGIKPHMTVFENLDDIHTMIDMARSGKSTGRFAIVFK